MRSAKEIFLASGHASALKEWVASEHFEPTCHLAIAQLASELRPTALPGQPVDPYVAIDANSQLWGARRVLEILHTLTFPVAEKPKSREPTLYHA